MREKLMDSVKTAMKAGDKPRVAVLRMVQAAIKDKDIDARGQGRSFGDDDILSLLQKLIKSRQESLTIYEQAGRQDLADQERGEILVIQEFLPQQMPDDEIDAAITAAIAQTQASGMKDMGKVVASLKEAHAGRMDFARASALVKARLQAGS